MRVYEVQFKASIKLAAEDENQAAKIARETVLNNPEIIYIEEINNEYAPVWWPIPETSIQSVQATPAAPSAEATDAYEIKDHECIGEPPL